MYLDTSIRTMYNSSTLKNILMLGVILLTFLAFVFMIYALKYCLVIDKYWDDTVEGVKKTRQAMDKVAEEQAHTFNRMLDSNNDECFNRQLKQLHDLMLLFLG
ncbi:hypothetical protein [Lactiplantibacillus pentosus]|uniref:hypothetical protein n=1 Tax=Lactiplantibacillus pentosus TaxID=1589 RepID=UPI001C20131C|nr:hypothetical protein [Lactiplantibacillus pentosus]MBU7553788.1 hypothetical protein [Lactiplantibacillus pentosus]